MNEQQPAPAEPRRDLLHDLWLVLDELQAHQENTGEFLEDEDASLIEQIKKEHPRIPAPDEPAPERPSLEVAKEIFDGVNAKRDAAPIPKRRSPNREHEQRSRMDTQDGR
jgi:hypothetical protein